MLKVNKQTCPHCFIDIDINHHRSKLGLAAAFVDATDSRYGLSSKDLRKLGGSEVSRINDLIFSDHEWSEKLSDGIEVRPPSYGSRIVVKLNWDEAPLACENFATLCTNGNATLLDPTNPTSPNNNSSKKVKTPIGQCGKPLTYKDSTIHRIEPGFIMQGGDFVFGNGSGGESIYNGKKFKDEKAGLQLKHDRKGILSMGNSGKNSNTSQFFITFQKTSQCDGKHVVFGEVISGFEVIDAIEKVANMSKDNGELPKLSLVQITDCGAFYPFQTPGAGFWFDQPDVDSFSGYTPVFMTRPRIAIIMPTKAAYDKFTKCIGSYAAVTTACLATAIGNDEDISSCKEKILDQVNEQLSSFAVDIVIVAPVYSDIFKSFDLPALWKENSNCYQPETHEVILVAKPVDALKAIKERAWTGKIASWQLDGNI